MRPILVFCLLLATPVAHAQPLVLELFTSQACSSCPPADALLSELASRPDLLALDMHVDYWNRLGWRDPYSAPQFTERQRQYAALLHEDTVYTPELVVGGTRHVVGSDRAAVLAAIAAGEAGAGVPLSLSLSRSGGGLIAEAGVGAGPATLWVVGFDRRHETRIGGGENGGRTLVESNVVRALAPVASWTGAAMRVALAPPSGETAAVFLQARDGRIIGAASLSPLGAEPPP